MAEYAYLGGKPPGARTLRLVRGGSVVTRPGRRGTATSVVAASAAMVLGGLGLVLAAFVATFSVGQQWWWEPEVAVPRDGGTHRVSLEDPGEPYAIWGDRSLVDPVCTLTGDDRVPIEVAPVPSGERVVLDEPWAAEPEASSTFTAPADGVVVATCDAVYATPVQELHLAPMHPRIYYDAMQYGPFYLGLLLVFGGIAVAVVTAIRPRTRR
jgi:hypothetical protein